jgi:hypothetical protein
MRAVRTDRKLKLEEEFVGGSVAIFSAAQLAANLAELARPERQVG